MAEIIEDGYQNRHYQRRWLSFQYGALPTDSVCLNINIPILGVYLDVVSMVKDVSEQIAHRLETSKEWRDISQNGNKPVMIHESNFPNRTWFVGRDGLMKNECGDKWEYMTEEEIADTNLLDFK